jgi:hypothetical protein
MILGSHLERSGRRDDLTGACARTVTDTGAVSG